MTPSIKWPDNRRFAFTVFDDTDQATVENTSAVYGLLSRLGFRTTKSVWPLGQSEGQRIGGSACDDPEYLRYVKSLQRDGFEIGYHNARVHSSTRQDSQRALDEMKQLFGISDLVMSHHSRNRENMYWGSDRLSGWRGSAYELLNKQKRRPKFLGAAEGSEFFWGDLSYERVKYVRNFIFRDINTLKMCPWMPYSDRMRPYVRYWYASSDADNPRGFASLISERNQDQLEAEGGACIAFTHFGKKFQTNGAVDPEVERLLRRLSTKNGWFVPVGQLLDFLMEQGAGKEITDAQRTQLEQQFLFDCVARNVHRLTPKFLTRPKSIHASAVAAPVAGEQ